MIDSINTDLLNIYLENDSKMIFVVNLSCQESNEIKIVEKQNEITGVNQVKLLEFQSALHSTNNTV